MFGSRRLFSEGCNFVHNDEIWKDHVNAELRTARRWPHTWGSMVDLCQQANCSIELEGTQQQRHHSIRLTPPLRLYPSYSARITETQHQLQAIQQYSRYPQTTTGVIGWDRSKLGNKSWRLFGSCKRGIVGIHKLLNQPEPSILQRSMY